MTPAEQQLATDLHQKLGVCEQSGLDNTATMVLGQGLTAILEHGTIFIETEGGSVVALNPELLQALNRFAESIGWQCD